MRKEEKERRILAAAERLFTERRFHEVKMDDVSRAAGVGKGTIYRYFKDKDDLFVRLVITGFDDLCGRVSDIAAEEAPLRERLIRLSAAVRDSHARRMPLFRMMHGEHARLSAARRDLHDSFHKGRDRLLSALGGIFREGARSGVLRRDLPPETLAACFLGMMRGRAAPSGRARRGPSDPVVTLFLDGAAARSSLNAGARSARRSAM